MQGNLVVFTIIIVLFVVLALIGFAIYWAQTSLGRVGGGGGTSATSSGEDA
jgi:ABC-type transporter Mla subunit MlaD